MPAIFFDSSALVKRYVREVGTEWVRSLIATARPRTVYIAAITRVEVAAAIARRGQPGDLLDADVAATIALVRNHATTQYVSLAVSATVLDRAVDVAERYALRGYDAVQLAALLELRSQRGAAGLSDPRLISSDAELTIAARAEGVAADDPNAHP